MVDSPVGVNKPIILGFCSDGLYLETDIEDLGPHLCDRFFAFNYKNIMINYIFEGLYYLALAYTIFTGLVVLLSFITPTHIINKKYWGFVSSGIIGLTIGIYSYLSNNHIIILIALILPFVILKICGGEPDLDLKKNEKQN